MRRSCPKTSSRLAGLAGLVLSAFLVTTAAGAKADTPWDRPVLGFMGVPGLVDMPSGEAMPDGMLSFTVGRVGEVQRHALHFQIAPRLSGVFRYAIYYGLPSSSSFPNLYDRSFDLRYQLATETATRPAIAIGLQDIWGTGISSAEYIAATKSFGRLKATAGLGWGRLGTFNGIDNPLGVLSDRFDTRPDRRDGLNVNGDLRTDHWFRGDAAFFAGLQYAVSDRLVLSAEYSSDDYRFEEDADIGFVHRSPVNLGVTWRTRRGLDLSAAWLYGSTLGVQLSYNFNPKRPNRFPGGVDPAPVPVQPRPPGAAADLGWTQDRTRPGAARTTTATLLAAEGMMLEAMAVSADTATLRVRTGQQTVAAQALGRVARILTRSLPASVETFVIIPTTGTGLPASAITLSRSDLEELETAPDGAWQSYARAAFSDAWPVDRTLAFPEGTFPKFDWSLAPYLTASYFDPDSPVRLDYGLELSARYEPRPGLVFAGALRGQLSDDGAEDLPPSDSKIRRVRTDAPIYARESDGLALSRLTAAQYFRPGPDLYGRVTLGYLEPMYGGLSTELLWKPVTSRLAFGVEINYAQQRDFDQRFGFQDYGVMTGHVSAYYAGAGGFDYRVDAGRYLAGDWGATFAVDRRFGNGIKVGVFATLTDVPFDDFGEGSFDKGLRFEVPFAALTGRSSDRGINRVLRPVQRDGGARLDVAGRLYEGVRDFHRPAMQEQWGRFWR
ncbi:YjbH domain-containing protein [Cognatishimia sp. F0-27]|uniref:YjbH domain-containing protein n=1 Tax=Cognatishimia sp. F0-27 TaxID=2816855 RepID=UPI001D0C7006|nr:YjbH domain-containing protein [Cognatishimia sp. F0-27]